MHAVLQILAESDTSSDAPAIFGPASGGGLLLYVVVVIGLWGMFRKAGFPSWYALIPILNLWTILKLAGRSGWWLLLYLIPIVNLIITIIVAFDIGRKFGKGGVFSFFLLFLLPPIGYLVLGLGSARYDKNA